MQTQTERHTEFYVETQIGKNDREEERKSSVTCEVQGFSVLGLALGFLDSEKMSLLAGRESIYAPSDLLAWGK